ncbi:CDP-glycerol glycerophosphotransferase family protein [Gemmatimonadota bacterium]
MNSVLLQVVRLFLNVFHLLSYLVFKNNKLWLFSAWYGNRFLDNPKYLYKYALLQGTDVKAIWISKNRKLLNEVRRAGFICEYAYSPKGLWYQLRAGVVIFTHSVEADFFAPAIATHVKRVQTWHGVPIKKIGFDDEMSRTTRQRIRLKIRLFPYLTDRCDIVFACSEFDRDIYASAFKVSYDNIYVTGYARNDILIETSSKTQYSDNNEMKIIYMPTLRGRQGSDYHLLHDAGFDYDMYDAMLNKYKMSFHIRLHPVQNITDYDKECIDRCRSIHLVTEVDDIYEVLGQYDVLISDYSGIYFDYLLLDRPILLAPIDFNEYLQTDREHYRAYEEFCPSPACYSWNDVIDRLVDKPIVTDRQKELKLRFHQYTDDTHYQSSSSLSLTIAQTQQLQSFHRNNLASPGKDRFGLESLPQLPVPA